MLRKWLLITERTSSDSSRSRETIVSPTIQRTPRQTDNSTYCTLAVAFVALAAVVIFVW